MRTVLIRKPQRIGSTARMVKAAVLGQTKDGLRVVIEGTSKPISVKASEVRDAPAVFGNRPAMGRGVVVQKALPDSPSSLTRILEKRGF